MELKVIDGVIPEPLGGAHREPDRACQLVKEAVIKALSELEGFSPEELMKKRVEKYYRMGSFEEMGPVVRERWR